MRKLFTLKTFMLLLVTLVSVGAWAEDPDWSATSFSGSVTDNSITVEDVTWKMTASTVASGSPVMAVSGGKLKFGSSKSIFFSSYTISTSDFSDYNVTKVEIGCYDNGGTESAVTVKQGDVVIGSSSVTQTSTAKDIVLNDNVGEGGDLHITYTSTKQASYITYIKVYYVEGGETVDVESVSLNKSTLSLMVSKKETLSATVSPANATNKKVTWSTSDANVATVTNGVVTGVGVGNATITATTVDGSFKATCDVTVSENDAPEVDEIVIYETGFESTDGFTATTTYNSVVNQGPENMKWKMLGTTTTNDKKTGSQALQMRVYTGQSVAPYAETSFSLSNVTSVKFNYRSEDIAVCKGIIVKYSLDGGESWETAETVAAQNTSWTATAASVAIPEQSATMRIRLELDYKAGSATKKFSIDDVQIYGDASDAVAVTGISLDKTSDDIFVGGTTTLTATVAPADATNKNVTWTSSNDAVATVKNGVVTGVSEGSATITVKTADGEYKATCTVTVSAIHVTRVSLDKSALSIMATKSESLVATVAPDNAANKNVTWTSSNEDVATVADGVVTAVAEGSATITVTTADGGFTATCNVTVTPYVESPFVEFVFTPANADGDSSSSWGKTNAASLIFSSGSEFISSIDACNNVYPARNSLVNGVKFGTSSVAGSIKFSLTDPVKAAKLIVSAAAYGDSEGQDGFTINGNDVSMTGAKNKEYADYSVTLDGSEISSITLTQKTADKGRIYVKSIKIVKCDEVTVSDANYTTYFNSQMAYVMPEDCEGNVWTAARGLEVAYEAGEVVPAGEPLVIYSTTVGKKVLEFATSSGETYKSADMNDLDGTDAKTDLEADANAYFYGLSLNAESELSSVGFYWIVEDGAAFTNGAHKAYLKLAKAQNANVRSFRFSAPEETGITNVNAADKTNVIYNLAGQRVSANAKGLVIVNGKKFANK